MALLNGDELIGNTGAVTVRASCGANTKLELSGPFRVRFLLTANQGCKFLSTPKPGGRVNVSSTVPTNVQSGNVKMATKKTEYEIHYVPITVSRTVRVKGRRRLRLTTRIQQEVIAYKDEIEVTVKGSRLLTVNEGEKVVTTAGVPARVDNITTQDIAETASVRARIQVSQLPPSVSERERKKAFADLQILHQEVLADPRNQPKLINLVNEQIKLGLPTAQVITTPLHTVTPTPTWPVELNANMKAVERLRLTNRCPLTVRIRIRLKLAFAHLLSKREIEIPPGTAGAPGETYVRFEFDTTQTKPGDYKGELFLDCLNCPKENDCSAEHTRIPVTILVKEVKVESTHTNEMRDEQAQLFELLRQGKYNEAIDGFERRVLQKRADSRDNYGAAVGYEQLKDNERAAYYANEALKFFATDQRMSKEELIDCERIAKLQAAVDANEPDLKTEQARLFELLRQGKYKEALAGFEARLDHGLDSRDAYGAALAYAAINEPGRAVQAAHRALSVNNSDRRLSEKEQADCERIAGSSVPTEPTNKMEVHNVTLKRDTKATIETDLQRSTCREAHRLGLMLKNLPFIHLPSRDEKIIAPAGQWSLLLEFDTTGMKAGDYQGQVLVACLDCSKDPSCVLGWYRTIQINLEVTNEGRKQ
jgi:hypothetical protein